MRAANTKDLLDDNGVGCRIAQFDPIAPTAAGDDIINRRRRVLIVVQVTMLHA